MTSAYTAVVSHDTGDDPETGYLYYADGHVLATGTLAECLAVAMSFGNNCNPQEGARVMAEDGYVVWRYAGNRLVRSQFRGLVRQEIDEAIAAAAKLGWLEIGEAPS
ncbi:MAG: hypothetical protein HQL33_05655 [Alphaproteobacteria bacterium]|nr:hypothetical protein [Alphaproteobacteria bacterium]MBF0129455.1 hypothetical protein [Alphaproteobacteria bacterium]